MNITNFSHAVLALFAQAILGLTTGNWWIGAAFGGAFYFGREVAQYETDQLKHFGKRAAFGSDDGMPWYEGFKLFNWSTDGQFDLLVPVASVCVAGFFLEKYL